VVDSLGVVARRQLLEEFVQTQLVAYDGESFIRMNAIFMLLPEVCVASLFD